MYRVLFLGDKLCSWGGGVDYLCQIICAYTFLAETRKDIELEMNVVVLNPNSVETELSDGDKNRIQTLIEGVLKINPSIKIHLVEHSGRIRDLVHSLKPDFCIPVLQGLIKEENINYVTYLGDFQEEYLPEFFSAFEIKCRRQNNKYIIDNTKNILATSQSAFDDITKYYGKPKAKVFVQPFAPLSSPRLWDTFNVKLEKYNLPSKYFIISNQFWQHKNHLTAFKAVNSLVSDGYDDIVLLCTGEMNDYRNADYIFTLKDYVKTHSLEKNIRFLGYLPKLDQIEIMKKSLALIQPTLFEGDPGGCSVYEAVSYGKKVVMSDIPVNKEAKGTKGVFYFSPFDYEKLGEIMLKLQIDNNSSYSIEEVKNIYENNSNKLGNFYLSMFREIVLDNPGA